MFKVINWVVISRSNLLTDLMDTRWPQEFLVKLLKIPPEKAEVEISTGAFSLIIIDLATVDIQKAYQIQKFVEKKLSARVVFLHFPRQIDARFLIHSTVTAGVFYCNATLESIGHGLGHILRGQTIIPSDLLQKKQDNSSQLEGSESLTIREREVLQALLSGSTNVDIANQLFVSESTIKTHLYRAFRKIGVSSRGQAIAWSQTHLHEVQH